jgi:hypothetical protein
MTWEIMEIKGILWDLYRKLTKFITIDPKRRKISPYR